MTDRMKIYGDDMWFADDDGNVWRWDGKELHEVKYVDDNRVRGESDMIGDERD
jgi:hypothetical protein